MSTNFFQNFEKIYYQFGDESSFSLMQNLTQYVDLIDHLKSQTAFYEDYTIKSGDRPDTLSLQLYGDQKYYWTFFLLNDDLRESGWPLKNEEVLKRTKEFYPHRVLTINSDISSAEGGYDFRVGRRIEGNDSGTHGIIIKRNLDLGQLIVDVKTDAKLLDPPREFVLDVNSNGVAEIQLTNEQEIFATPDLWKLTKQDLSETDSEPLLIAGHSIELTELNTRAKITSIPFQPNDNVRTFEYKLVPVINLINPDEGRFIPGEVLRMFDPTTGLEVQKRIALDDDGDDSTLDYQSETAQYLAVHHYENSDGEFVDIDPYSSTLPSGLTAVTNLERVQKRNEELKQIKVLKADVIQTIVKDFYSLMNQK